MCKKWFSALLIGFMAVSAMALEFRQEGERVLVSSARLTATVYRGRIVHLVSRPEGTVIASESFAEPSQTAGLGCMLGKVKELSRIHFPWGETSLNQHIEQSQTPLYHSPGEQSKLKIQQEKGLLTLTWTGLASAEGFFADEILRLTLSEDAAGALVLRAYGRSEDGGVFGVQVPVENISNEAKFILPTFGGLEYSGKGKPALMTFKDTTLFYEAPLMTLELQESSFAMWKEDERMRPYFAFFARNLKSCSFALESLNLIPYETCKEIQAPVLKLDWFAGGDWLAAARPFRNWYHRVFAEDMGNRDRIDWANRINVICDSGSNNDETLSKVAELMPKEQVLFHFWQARKEGFTTNIPDYTPKDAYPGDVARIHKHGFKVMAYTCTICAVYQSPAWIRDNVGDFFLTRKNDITRYNGGEENISENLVGTVNFTTGQDQFKGMKPKQFLYGDPLSKGWRDYYCRIIKEFNTITGTDANYQDTSGCSGDQGNGIIDGMAGAEAYAQMIRDLQKAMPDTPMASEFGPQAIGFGVKWPLNYAQVWGGEAFRRSRLHRHRPLSPFLFGYRTWVPTINANDDFHKHVITASSDALSGMGMFSSSSLGNEAGFDGHLLLRSQVYAQNRLTPFYPELRYPENIRAMYQDDKGRIFRYYDDGNLQKMLDPEGRALYGRVDKLNRINDPDLYLPGWPIQDENGIHNLDPAKNYALFPKKVQPTFPVGIRPLPEGTALKRYYTTADFAYLELSAADDQEISATFLINEKNYRKAYLNDQEIVLANPLQIRCKTAARLLLSSGKDTVPDTIRNISTDDGLQHGKDEPLPSLKRNMAGRTLYFVNYFQAKSLDYLLTVPEENNTLELCLVNTQAKYGNGSIVRLLINGKEMRSFDCIVPNPEWSKDNKDVPKTLFDQKLRQWLIPLKDYAGKQILVTVQVDNKAQNNADSQWVSLPRLLPVKTNEIEEHFLDPLDNTPQSYRRPAGKVLQELVPDWKSEEFQLQNGLYTYTPAKAHGVVYYHDKQEIDRTRNYILSGEFKAGVDQGSIFYLGVVQYNEHGKEINGIHINRRKDTVTVLSHPAEAGSDRVMVLNAANWTPGSCIAIAPADDHSDLPRFDLTAPIRELKQHGGDWSAYLESPLKSAITSDTKVCLHTPTSTHSYVCSAKAPNRFVRFGGKITWWPGAKTFKILLISQKPLEFTDLKLEIMEGVQ